MPLNIEFMCINYDSLTDILIMETTLTFSPSIATSDVALHPIDTEKFCVWKYACIYCIYLSHSMLVVIGGSEWNMKDA